MERGRGGRKRRQSKGEVDVEETSAVVHTQPLGMGERRRKLRRKRRVRGRRRSGGGGAEDEEGAGEEEGAQFDEVEHGVVLQTPTATGEVRGDAVEEGGGRRGREKLSTDGGVAGEAEVEVGGGREGGELGERAEGGVEGEGAGGGALEIAEGNKTAEGVDVFDSHSESLVFSVLFDWLRVRLFSLFITDFDVFFTHIIRILID